MIELLSTKSALALKICIILSYAISLARSRAYEFDVEMNSPAVPTGQVSCPPVFFADYLNSNQFEYISRCKQWGIET
jgi:hypothetical protein